MPPEKMPFKFWRRRETRTRRREHSPTARRKQKINAAKKDLLVKIGELYNSDAGNDSFIPFSQVKIDLLGKEVVCLVHLSRKPQQFLKQLCNKLNLAFKIFIENKNGGSYSSSSIQVFCLSTETINNENIIFTKISVQLLDEFMYYLIGEDERYTDFLKKLMKRSVEQRKKLGQSTFHPHTLMHTDARTCIKIFLGGKLVNGKYEVTLPEGTSIDSFNSSIRQVLIENQQPQQKIVFSYKAKTPNTIIYEESTAKLILSTIGHYLNPIGSISSANTQLHFIEIINSAGTKLYVCLLPEKLNYRRFLNRASDWFTKGQIDHKERELIKNCHWLADFQTRREAVYCDWETMEMLLRRVPNIVKLVDPDATADSSAAAIKNTHEFLLRMQGTLPTRRTMIAGLHQIPVDQRSLVLDAVSGLKYEKKEENEEADAEESRYHPLLKDGRYDSSNSRKLRGHFANNGDAIKDLTNLLTAFCRKKEIFDTHLLASMLTGAEALFHARRNNLRVCKAGILVTKQNRYGAEEVLIVLRPPKNKDSEAKCFSLLWSPLFSLTHEELNFIKKIPRGELTNYFYPYPPIPRSANTRIQHLHTTLTNCNHYTEIETELVDFLIYYCERNNHTAAAEKLERHEKTVTRYAVRVVQTITNISVLLADAHASEPFSIARTTKDSDDGDTQSPYAKEPLQEDVRATTPAAPPKRHLRSQGALPAIPASLYLVQKNEEYGMRILAEALNMESHLYVADSQIRTIDENGQSKKIHAGKGLFIYGGNDGIRLEPGEVITYFGGEIIDRDAIEKDNLDKTHVAALSSSSAARAAKVLYYPDYPEGEISETGLAYFANHQSQGVALFELAFAKGGGRVLRVRPDLKDPIVIPAGMFLEATCTYGYSHGALSLHGIPPNQQSIPNKLLRQLSGVIERPNQSKLPDTKVAERAPPLETARTKRNGDKSALPPQKRAMLFAPHGTKRGSEEQLGNTATRRRLNSAT